MLGALRWVFILAMCLPDTKAIINEEVKIIKYPDKQQQARQESEEDVSIPRHFSSPLDKCTYKVHHVLGSLSSRRSSAADSSTLDLSGYALHQPLRSAPYDMYVTNLRLRLPHHKQGYIHIDKCRYDTLHKLLQTNLLFRDLSITGNIQLVSDTVGKKLLQQFEPASFAENNRRSTSSTENNREYLLREIDPKGKSFLDQLNNYDLYYNSNNPLHNNNNPYYNNHYQTRPVESCNMTLRLKSVGLGFSAIPERIVETDNSRNINIKTTATYLEPNYVSVHAYNCKNILARRSDNSENGGENIRVYRSGRGDGEEDLESEMEQVFIKGSRSLLTNYMEKQFKNVLRDSLMTNLGYTVSYGRK